MTLISELTLIEPLTYTGRHRKFIPSTTSMYSNKDNEVEYEEFEIKFTSVQPIDGYTLQALEEGYRSKAVYQFWTETVIRGLEQNTDQLSDQIFIDGSWFSIYNFKPWVRTSFLKHHHCVAIREDVNNSRDQNNTTGGNFGG